MWICKNSKNTFKRAVGGKNIWSYTVQPNIFLFPWIWNSTTDLTFSTLRDRCALHDFLQILKKETPNVILKWAWTIAFKMCLVINRMACLQIQDLNTFTFGVLGGDERGWDKRSTPWPKGNAVSCWVQLVKSEVNALHWQTEYYTHSVTTGF